MSAEFLDRDGFSFSSVHDGMVADERGEAWDQEDEGDGEALRGDNWCVN